MAGFIRGTFKRHFNISQWMGLKYIGENFKLIPSLFKRLSTPATNDYSETFEEAVVRLGLDQKKLGFRAREYFRAAVIYSCCGVIGSLYALSFINTGKYHGVIMGMMVASIFFAHAFRAHFWYTQIRMKKLGITLKEWACTFLDY
ncbi:MAG: hypothetical protein CMF42_02730 [Legionellales bacterium]|nr:hypothetical protein [Legionellales bacterium]|tara:strand:+ start:7830 stop:8264 length:435 start_codon:yes stop_codon:yes gene_type:complete